MRLPPFKLFPKQVYNYEKRKPQDILKMLETETAIRMMQNPGYRLHGFIGPHFMPDKSVVYYIKFKICASLIQ